MRFVRPDRTRGGVCWTSQMTMGNLALRFHPVVAAPLPLRRIGAQLVPLSSSKRVRGSVGSQVSFGGGGGLKLFPSRRRIGRGAEVGSVVKGSRTPIQGESVAGPVRF